MAGSARLSAVAAIATAAVIATAAAAALPCWARNICSGTPAAIHTAGSLLVKTLSPTSPLQQQRPPHSVRKHLISLSSFRRDHGFDSKYHNNEDQRRESPSTRGKGSRSFILTGPEPQPKENSDVSRAEGVPGNDNKKTSSRQRFTSSSPSCSASSVRAAEALQQPLASLHPSPSRLRWAAFVPIVPSPLLPFTNKSTTGAEEGQVIATYAEAPVSRHQASKERFRQLPMSSSSSMSPSPLKPTTDLPATPLQHRSLLPGAALKAAAANSGRGAEWGGNQTMLSSLSSISRVPEQQSAGFQTANTAELLPYSAGKQQSLKRIFSSSACGRSKERQAAAALSEKNDDSAVVVEKEEETQRRLKEMIENSKVLLFMKGTPDSPRCGFSAFVVAALRKSGLEEFCCVDVLADAAVRSGVKTFSSFPTIPQLFIGGEFIGGADIVKEMLESGELQAKLQQQQQQQQK